MKNQEETKYACLILFRFVNSKEQRLKNGAMRRKQILQSIKDGKTVSGYRPEWMLNTIDVVLKTLITESEKFNNTYYDDMVSVEDMKDILASVIHKLNIKGKD